MPFPVHSLDFYSDFLLIAYSPPNVRVDIYSKTGNLVTKIDIERALFEEKLVFKQTDKVLYPKLKWADRVLEDID